MASHNFSSLPLSGPQITNLDALGYRQMTPVQAQALPHILNGKDLIARAKTGSGKTAAFGIGLIHLLKPQLRAVQALIICPTRELADQVGNEIRKLSRYVANIRLVMLCGGKPFRPQQNTLEHGAHIVVGTPGRIQDHLDKATLSLDHINILVLDEADRMLDMGFIDVINKIIAKTPKSRQTLLFSATYPDTIQQMCRSILRKPVTVTLESEHKPGIIEQLFYQVKKHERNNALLALFEHYKPLSTVVFCHTKKQCDEVALFLNNHRVQAMAIHGDLDQRQRDQVLVQFSNHSCPVLVATDVAARGLDIKALQAVINFELPRDADVYIHRIGRTGRAGNSGLGLSLFTEAEQVRLNAIEQYQKKPCICDVPASLDRDSDFILQSPMQTIRIDAGRKNKIRPGDILGALTGDAGLHSDLVGKIDIFDNFSYVAINRSAISQALRYLSNGKIKARSVRAYKIHS